MPAAARVRRFFLGWVLLAALVGAGCEGCKDKPKAGSPLQFIPQDADAVLEVRDVGVLIRAREGIAKSFGALVPPEQVKSLQGEFERALGFDPTTAEGLAQAGLPAKGGVAVHVVGDGRGAVWVVPVTDPKKMAPMLLSVVKARVTVDKTTVEKVGAHEVTVYVTQFGADEVTVAAHVFARGFVLIGAGRKSVDMLKAALAVTPETSVAKSAEYAALSKGLGDKWDLRMISPRGGETLKGALRTAARTVPEARALLGAKFELLSSVGWTADFSPRGLDVQGQLRLTDEGKKLSKKLFAVEGEPAGGVKAIGVPEAIVFAQAALHPATILELLAPENSPNRASLDRVTKRAKKDVDIDPEKEIFPLLTGHAAVALGVGGLEKVSFKELMGNPRSVLWTAFGLGVKEPEAAIALEKRLDPGLKARGLEIVSREVKGKTIRSLVPPKKPTDIEAPAALVETFGLSGAWVFANEAALTNRVVDNEAAASALGGRPGAYLEINFRELNRQLASFRFGDLPVLYRSLLAKVMDAVKLLEGAKLRVHPDAEGVRMSAELRLIPLAGS